MNSKKIEFSVGIFVLLGILAILYLAIQIGSSRFLGGDMQQVKAKFTDVGGLNSGSNVMVAGVKIGVVSDIVLDEELYAIVEMNLPSDFEIDAGTIASIRTNGLIGDKYISLNPGNMGFPLEEGEMIIDTEPALNIEGLISRFAFGDLGNSNASE